MSTDEDRSRADTSDDGRKSPDTERQLALTARPRHRSASPRDGQHDPGAGGPGCPVRGRRLTPGEMQSVNGVRRRYYSMSASMMTRPTITPRSGGGGGSDAPRKLRVSRDATQPATGSMRSLRSSSQDSEEADEFPDRSLIGGGLGGAAALPVCGRPRAATCPESKAFRRRARVRSFNRPPTPTPTPSGTDTETPAGNESQEDESSSGGDAGGSGGGVSQRFADLRLNVSHVREPVSARPGGVVTKSPSLGNCCAELPAISESQ